MDAAISNDTDLVAPTRTVTAERSTLVCIVYPGCGPELRPGDRAYASRPSTTLRAGMASDRRAGTARLWSPGQRKAIEVAKCRRETVERIITVAMGAPLDVTELR